MSPSLPGLIMTVTIETVTIETVTIEKTGLVPWNVDHCATR